jgi:hypothetical protein
MAGSLKWFNYETDQGVAYAILNDESKAEATISTGGTGLAEFTTGAETLPRGIRPRYVNCFDTAVPTRKARIKIGDPATFGLITAGTTITEAGGTLSPGATWRVTSKRGEQATLPFSGDTGITDGDA